MNYSEEKHKRESSGKFGASEHNRKPGDPVGDPEEQQEGEPIYVSYGETPVLGQMIGPDPQQPENMIVVIGNQKLSVHGSRLHQTYEEAEAMLNKTAPAVE